MTNSTNSDRIRVAVIYGGRSSEHSISCISAGAVIGHLDPQRYEVIPVGITREGAWTVGEADPAVTDSADGLPEVGLKEEVALSLNPARRGEFIRVASGEPYAVADVILPILHGPFGEDGTIQGLFEIAGVPYVGPGVLASAVGMDKEYTKKLASAAGLRVAPEAVLAEGDEFSQDERDRLGLPLFVKPANGGSSIGISKVERAEDIDEAIAEARKYDTKVIVESMIHGVEVEVGVLQFPDGRLLASPPAQLNGTEDSDEGFYGFETKYLEDVVSATIPADLPADTIKDLQEMAVRTFKAMDCKGLARVDFFVAADGPVLNEINTMPGFTPISMYPQVFNAAGIAYAELLDTLIHTALARG
ncbi:D-alanine--D-alanine ligase family protein [Corynebacterium uterequi]|uniref:D-alanine--D-alanine ligase n=1 Tax=Corynebacterium uterequi TaxID=1072256 RepID=A0A0G3HG93_9CORY|nr:D-alanine--D-alanine ligase family protein [Corynebacterium uterequi]AKK10973.1 D-alanine--D-alanine ligase [Corynebacterium uterequi]